MFIYIHIMSLLLWTDRVKKRDIDFLLGLTTEHAIKCNQLLYLASGKQGIYDNYLCQDKYLHEYKTASTLLKLIELFRSKHVVF